MLLKRLKTCLQQKPEPRRPTSRERAASSGRPVEAGVSECKNPPVAGGKPMALPGRSWGNPHHKLVQAEISVLRPDCVPEGHDATISLCKQITPARGCEGNTHPGQVRWWYVRGIYLAEVGGVPKDQDRSSILQHPIALAARSSCH